MLNKKMIDRLLLLWSRFPELRLGQLILNICPEEKLYYIEDSQLEKLLNTYPEAG